jgi:hypothetical protein
MNACKWWRACWRRLGRLEDAELADLLDDEPASWRWRPPRRSQEEDLGLVSTSVSLEERLAMILESESEVAEASQLCMVEAMWKANWPAQRRSTEVEQAPLESAATHGIEGNLLGRRLTHCQEGLGPESRAAEALQLHGRGHV